MEQRRDSREDFRRLAILIAVATVDLMGAAMVFPLLPFYAAKFESSPLMIGIIFSSFSMAQLIAAPLWGRVSDNYGRRPALLIGLVALGAGYLIFGFANSKWMLLLSRIIQGAGGGTTGVTQAYVADTVGSEDRARALGWLSAGTNVGTMLGPALGSFLAHWGQAAPGGVAAALCTINLLFAWRWLPESRKADQTPAERKPVWHGVWRVLRHPSGMAQKLTLIYALGMFGQSTLSAVLALYLAARFGVTEYTIGFFFVYVGLISVVLRSAFVGPAVDRLGEPTAILLGTASLSAGFLMYPLAPSIAVLAAVIPLIPVGTALLFPATTALLSKKSDKAELGLTMGIAQSFASLSRLIAPVTATAFFQYIGQPSPFFFAAGVVISAGMLALSLRTPAVRARESERGV